MADELAPIATAFTPVTDEPSPIATPLTLETVAVFPIATPPDAFITEPAMLIASSEFTVDVMPLVLNEKEFLELVTAPPAGARKTDPDDAESNEAGLSDPPPFPIMMEFVALFCTPPPIAMAPSAVLFAVSPIAMASLFVLCAAALGPIAISVAFVVFGGFTPLLSSVPGPAANAPPAIPNPTANATARATFPPPFPRPRPSSDAAPQPPRTPPAPPSPPPPRVRDTVPTPPPKRPELRSKPI